MAGCSWTPGKHDEPPRRTAVVGPSQGNDCSDGRPALAAAPKPTSKALPSGVRGPSAAPERGERRPLDPGDVLICEIGGGGEGFEPWLPPCEQVAAYRCAELRFCRSPRTIRGEVRCSDDRLVATLALSMVRCTGLHPWSQKGSSRSDHLVSGRSKSPLRTAPRKSPHTGGDNMRAGPCSSSES
jgi:hypothetical protein